jgi:peptidoglycan/LPS O-acetylase OafA/YrhL
MYEKKSKDFSWPLYKQFLIRRFKRIAPAFYLLIVIGFIMFYYKNGIFPYQTAVFHLLFINGFLEHNYFSPHFWSLSTEWQFYLILPFLFFNISGKKNTLLRVLLLIVICLIFRALLFYRYQHDLLAGITIDSQAIWYRFVEFGIGIIAGRLYIDNWKLPAFLQGNKGFLLSFVIAYFGRICMVTEFVARFKQYGFLVRTIGEPVMTFGFGLIIYGLITSHSIIRRLICTKPVLFIGKISYSMYLWHWLVAQMTSEFIIGIFHPQVPGLYLSFVLSVFILLPVSWLSYRLFEAPYFKKPYNVPQPIVNVSMTAEESL